MSSVGGKPRRSFGPHPSSSSSSPPDPFDRTAVPFGSIRDRLGRLSLSRRPSFISNWRGNVASSDHENALDSATVGEQPPIPAVLQQAGEPYTTPLPVLSMIVLSIAMLGEFLSANVATPFLLFMVKGFDPTQDEAEIAFLTGILVSCFFLTQFFTSLLWAAVAERHGRRIVLTLSLLGSAITCFAFGMTTSFREAVCVRLLQGIFGGAIGVARGSVAFVTDPSNEGRAYAILGFCWGMGGVAGAIIGGATETPAEKWPIFVKVPILVQHPYLFPCAIAASVTFIGSFLSLFLGPDGGPREGAIQLSPEKLMSHSPIPEEDSMPPTPLLGDEHQPKGVVGSIGKKLSQRISGYFASSNDANAANPPPSTPVPLTTSSRPRAFSSRTSRVNGSAYGYNTSFRNRLASNATFAGRSLRRGSASASAPGSWRRRRGSHRDGLPPEPSEYSDLNFAQRLLMANENAVTNIADLWVAAAMNVDNEDPFESDSEVGSQEDEGLLDLDGEEALSDGGGDDDGPSEGVLDTPSRPSRPRLQSKNRRPSSVMPAGEPSHRPSYFGTPRRPSVPVHPGLRSPSVASHGGSALEQPSGAVPTTGRRMSNSVPAIFSHTGVRTPPAVIDAQNLLLRSSDDVNEDELPSQQDPLLAPILESRRQSQADVGATHIHPDEVQSIIMEEKSPGLMSMLPIMVILQYGLLAFHSTTHDQIFMSYLVTDYESGGLNLNAGHFAQLTALMCFCQIAFQFYLYPNVGPPRGRFSHLAMFRLGSILFIPSYLTVVLYRVPFASEEDDGNFMLMSALSVSTAFRYCGSTFAYTAISILLNYMTPPQAVGLANGIAQSIVSLARCFGPILGGLLWSVSIEGNPNGYPLGFFAIAAVCALSVLQSFVIR